MISLFLFQFCYYLFIKVVIKREKRQIVKQATCLIAIYISKCIQPSGSTISSYSSPDSPGLPFSTLVYVFSKILKSEY